MGTEVTPSVPHIPPLFQAIIINDNERNRLKRKEVICFEDYKYYAEDRSRLRKAAEAFLARARGGKGAGA